MPGLKPLAQRESPTLYHSYSHGSTADVFLSYSLNARVLASNFQRNGHFAVRAIAPEPSVIAVEWRGQFTRVTFNFSTLTEAVGCAARPISVSVMIHAAASTFPFIACFRTLGHCQLDFRAFTGLQGDSQFIRLFTRFCTCRSNRGTRCVVFFLISCLRRLGRPFPRGLGRQLHLYFTHFRKSKNSANARWINAVFARKDDCDEEDRSHKNGNECG